MCAQGGAQNRIFYKQPVYIYIKVETDDAFNYVLSRRKGNINDITLNKVSYRKQNRGSTFVVDPEKNVIASSLITTQNLVVVSHSVNDAVNGDIDGDDRRRRRCYQCRWTARFSAGQCVSPSFGELCICSASRRRFRASTDLYDNVDSPSPVQ